MRVLLKEGRDEYKHLQWMLVGVANMDGSTDGRHLGTARIRSCSVRRPPEWEEVIKKIRRQ